MSEKKKLLPIVLSAKRSSWRMLDTHADEHDTRYSAIRPQILERDDNRCRFCNFKAAKYMEVHHIDDDHGNNDPKNLATACGFCHMCFHLGMCGIKDAGTIIWCPEITQADLNNLCRVLFVSINNAGKYSDISRNIFNNLESRAGVIKDELGDGAVMPGMLGQAFLDMSEEQYESRGKRLPGLRLLPKMPAYIKQVAYWQSDPAIFGKLQESDWERLLPKVHESIEQ